MSEARAYQWDPHADAADTEYERVLQLHRENRSTLGHLPYAAFEEAGRRGQIIVGSVDGEIRGYVLYSTPRHQTLKLVHVCVDAQVRGRGVAKLMVDVAAARNPERSMITAHCRVDYGIDGFWRSLDMVPARERPGRAASGSTLTIWTRRIGQFDLLENALFNSVRPIAVLDTNIVIDLFSSDEMQRPDREESRGLTADWLVDVVDLAVSPEVSAEINGLESASERQRIQSSLDGFVALRRAENMRTLAAEIVDRLPTDLLSRDASLRSDAKHLADAVIAGADYFVTRDENLQAATESWIHDEYGIDVLRPVEFLRRLIPPQAPTEFRSGQLESVGLRWQHLTEWTSELEDTFLIDHGEKGKNLRKAINAVLARPGSARLAVLSDERGRHWALLGAEEADRSLQVMVLRVARGSLGATVAFQLTRYLRSLALERDIQLVTIRDVRVTPVLQAALSADGFEGEPASVRIARHADTGQVRDVVTREEVADYEQRNWPQILLDKEVPVRIVPVQPRYARDLLGFNTTLIQTREALGFAREFVYFAAPGMKDWEAPSRVLWYVTADPGADPRNAIQAVVAHARVLDAQVLEVERAIERYRSLGVLRRGDIQKHARKGRVLVLRFEDTQLLDAPVAKKTFDAVLRKHGVTTSLITTRRAAPGVFDDVMRLQPGWRVS